eukprot:TRINITY_DN3156_c0_g3_i1.p1 TRINITY_DN3156_c0_g3~~TRINITY_DN3156_c0_g3_i1.p1  ORF type:complete len:1594 (-),score=373.42 TRINITY_DN3156_c0_g3_i1:2-4783(-)
MTDPDPPIQIAEKDDSASAIDDEIPVSDVALCGLSTTHSVRSVIIRFYRWQFFEIIALFFIVLDCVVMAANSPLNPRDSTVFRILEGFDIACVAVFTVESVIRIVAMGLVVAPQSYLRSPLNVLDTCIIIVSWATFWSTGYLLWWLRAIRIFRPLRSIRALPGLRDLTRALVSTFVDILPLILMLFMFYSMYAIMGTYFFAGTFRNFCFDELGNQDPEYLLCSPWNRGVRPCPALFNICRTGEPMLTSAFGIALFDNIYWSLLMVFQICTMENWAPLMYHAWRATSAWSILYFCTCLVFGTFVFLSMFLASVAESFEERLEALTQQEDEDQLPLPAELLAIRNRFASVAPSVANFKAPNFEANEPQMLKLVAHASMQPRANPAALQLQMMNVAAQRLVKPDLVELPLTAAPMPTATRQTVRAPLPGGVFTETSPEPLPQAEANSGQPTDGEQITNTDDGATEIPTALTPTTATTVRGVRLMVPASAEENALDTAAAAEELDQVAAVKFAPDDDARDSIPRKRFSAQIATPVDTDDQGLVPCWPATAAGGGAQCCVRSSAFVDSTNTGTVWLTIRRGCYVASEHFAWKLVVAFMIGINTLVLAAHHHNEPSWLEQLISITNTVLAALFCAELAVNLVGHGLYDFSRNPLNVIDALVTVAAILQLGISSSGVSTALRVLRVMRVLQLVTVWPGMASMVPTIISALRQSVYFFLLLLLLLFIYALFGMTLFAGKLRPLQLGSSQMSFDNFWVAFITSFQIMTISNWPNVMYDLVTNTESSVSPLFCVSLIILSSYVMLNLFVGLLMDKFGDQTEEEQKKRLANFVRDTLELKLFSSQKELSAKSADLQRYVDMQTASKLAERNIHIHVSLRYNSLFVFSKNNSFRRFCREVVTHSAFTTIVMMIVIGNSVALAFQSPSASPETLGILSILNIVFLVVFAVEFALHAVAYGVVLHPGSYLRNPWNVLDFIALVFAATDVGVPYNLSWVRATRTLRPLRLISNLRGMRLTAFSLIRSIQAMIGLMCVLLVVWLVFAIVGVQLWAGAFYGCSDPTVTRLANCTGVEPWLNTTRVWAPTYFPNFDDIGVALLTLFQMATLQSWELLAFNAMAAVGPGEAQVAYSNPSAGLYFLAFIIVGALFMMNLFIGVTVDNYHRERSVFEGTVLMTQPQREWWLIAKTLVNCKPEYLALPPTQQWRLALYNLVESRAWSFIVAGVAIGNAAVLMAWVTDPGQTLRDFSFWSGVAFSVIFIAEVLIEAIARGLRVYFSQGWGRFDTLIAIAAFCDIFITDPTASNVFVAFRALRIIQIARQIPRPLMVLRVLAAAFPQLISVGILLLFVYYIYAILGVNFFGSIALQGNLSEASNFASFPVAFLTMFRISSMDGWNDLMVSCMVQPPDCTAGVDCGFSAAPVFFVTFQLLCGFIMVNLFVAVLLGTLLNLTELNKSIASPKTIDTYAHVWSLFDPNATGFIKYDDLTNFRVRLPPPFGVPAFLSTAARYETMLPLKIPITTDGRVQYISVLLELTRHVVGVSLPPNATLFIRGQIEHALELEELSPWAVRDHAAAALIQIWWRGVRTRHNIAQLQQRMRSLRGISMSS